MSPVGSNRGLSKHEGNKIYLWVFAHEGTVMLQIEKKASTIEQSGVYDGGADILHHR